MNPLLEKINLLESKLGRKYSHKVLEPFYFNSANPLEVQKAGQKIAEHIGLPPLTFVVSYSHQKANIGGQIHLDSSKEVFIEISLMYKSEPDIVLSILAHEICHKYLYLNNIKLFPDYENEILTDIATIYTGLGKLSLNGCEVTNKKSQRFGNRITTSFTTYKVGYLNRRQFALVYRFVSDMRKVSYKQMLRGLSTDALKEIGQISSSNTGRRTKSPVTLKNHLRIVREKIIFHYLFFLSKFPATKKWFST